MRGFSLPEVSADGDMSRLVLSPPDAVLRGCPLPSRASRTLKGMGHTVNELRSMTDERLIEAHDRRATHAEGGVDYYLNEIARRDFSALAESVAASTKVIAASGTRMERLTWIIALLTLANVVLVAIAAT